ncbi:TetR family transcriptional regulator [Aeromicrobium fastidiosum]|uniref:TetR family transcriptional regulator n=1 Tax=Aeromicrobium fastidiosum TaxID=52699 RepID=A0A641AR08_9ACTN|nr:TetR family transcriptional regulator [Aeromicrobium fastidiosum]KAA1380544.1 TetR family transcriptional regulator [Aeromicrobium fastidiosum]MBP2390137.1 AcrR family transcriptional regulator [Aeromicrobium fastidiosum]
MPTEMTLRDHAREAVRDEVSKQAWALFARQGFEATTVDQIAEAAGMSRRTFFRYFAGKDELVLDRIVASGRLVADALRDRPADEAAWPALRAAFDQTVSLQEQHEDMSRRLQVMLRDEPALRTTVEARRRLWLELLAPLVAERLPRQHASSGSDLRAAAVTSSAIACLEVAQTTWATHPETSLAALLDEAMGAVNPLQ